MVYFEIKTPVQFGVSLPQRLEPGLYCTAKFDAKSVPKALLWNSDRIWVEDEDGVWFHKNRSQQGSAVVDMKEFLWVKLTAKSITYAG